MKYKPTALLMTLLMLSTVAAQTVSTGIGIGWEEQKFAPLVFLDQSGGRCLLNDPYGMYENGNIETRANNYAFTGEQVKWNVLVWDKNGKEKITDVYSGWVDQTNGPLPPEMESNCRLGTQLSNGANLAQAGYPHVRAPGEEQDVLEFDSASMAIYECVLTIEPACHGQKWMGVAAYDMDNLYGYMKEAESWFCNPVLDLTVSGSLNFGNLGPGMQGAKTISVENSAEAGSGTNLVLSVSATDFYDPGHSGAACPISNYLKQQGLEAPPLFNTGLWYTAVQGANSVGSKRMPYGKSNIALSDPIFSTGNGLTGNWAGSLVPMSPGSEASMTFHLGIPIPCNGQFTDGQIYLYGLAI
jgi:hypothetical protein